MIQAELTKKDIRDNFKSRDYTRGLSYYEQGKVLKYDIYGNVEEGIVIRSKVSGTQIYHQTIELNDFEDLEIESDCSCPVGYNCKHAVAVLLEVINHNHVFENKDVSHLWLEKFMTIQKEKESKRVSNLDTFLMLRVFEDTKSDFNFYKGKILKNGLPSKGTTISKDNMFYYAQYDWKYEFLTEDDRTLISQLHNTQNIYDNYCFEGEYGTLILKKLCESKRCFFRKSISPLVFSDTVKVLTFRWKENEAGGQLVSNLTENEFLIPKTIPPLYIDIHKNTLHKIETTYSISELECMLEAPTFSNDKINEIAHTILQESPKITFPLPASFEIEEIAVTPIPTLFLYGMKQQMGMVYVMELHFLYDRHQIASHPIKEDDIFLTNNVNIKIIRDSKAERLAREAIEVYGFETNSQMLGYSSPANPTMQTAIERWRNFTKEGIPKLSEEGWNIEIDESFNFNFEYMEEITVESAEGDDTNPWFELSFTVEIGGCSVALVPIVASILHEFDTIESLPKKLNLEIEEGRYLHVNAEEIKPILKTIFELFDKKEGDNLVIKPYDAHLLELDEQSNIIWKGTKELKDLSQKLKNFEGIESVPPSTKLQAKLREYQQFGLDWLNFLYTFKFSGILADDMGLGKTVQTLAFLQLLKERGEMKGSTLIVMPTSLMGNWKNEIEKFTPNLTYLELYGSDRATKFREINDYDIILTTYALAQRDQAKYDAHTFFYIVLDEAQKIKNPKTKLAVAIKGFKSSHKLALSGTPIENHLGELWSIFDFLMPGFLDNLSFFRSYYQNPIEQDRDMSKRKLLNKKVAPFILRRTKDEVVTELPPKTEIIKKAIFGKKQATLYENIRISMEAKVKDVIKGKGLSRSHITILDALLKLRQVCCHPQLLKLDSAKDVHDSTKLEMFLELIDELHEEGRKVLVFSQFTSMLSIIEEEIKKRKISYTKLTGATRKREEVISKFTNGDVSIFLISLKAGGVGLNLVEADTVIHYDPWWNPAVENQATDRAYRIGQDKPVFVYKLIVENSIEEQILTLQEKKKSLQEGIYQGKEQSDDKFSGEELMALLKM